MKTKGFEEKRELELEYVSWVTVLFVETLLALTLSVENFGWVVISLFTTKCCFFLDFYSY